MNTRTSSSRFCNRPFPSLPQPPFQSEAKCEVFVMKIILIEIRPNYHNKHFALRLASKEKLRGTRKWPIISRLFQVAWLGKCVPTILELVWRSGEKLYKFVVKNSRRPFSGKKSRPFHIVERTRTLRNVQKVTIDRFSVFLRNEQTNVHFLF